jgi:hypothetical protein
MNPQKGDKIFLGIFVNIIFQTNEIYNMSNAIIGSFQSQASNLQGSNMPTQQKDQGAEVTAEERSEATRIQNSKFEIKKKKRIKSPAD